MDIKGSGSSISVSMQSGDSRELHDIVTEHLPRFLALFDSKNKDYGAGGHEGLGIRAQYVDLSRKVLKLKRVMWDNQGLEHEQVDEVLLDLIGHCFLTLNLLSHSEMGEALEREWVYGNDPASAVSTFIEQCGGPQATLAVIDAMPRSSFAAQVNRRVQEILQAERMERAEYDRLNDLADAATGWRSVAAGDGIQHGTLTTEEINSVRAEGYDMGEATTPCEQSRVVSELETGQVYYWLERPGQDRVRLRLVEQHKLDQLMKSQEVLGMSARELYRGFNGL
jgi:hypothetical protein